MNLTQVLIYQHFAARHLVKQHFVQQHLVKRHFVQRHLVQQHFAKWHFVHDILLHNILLTDILLNDILLNNILLHDMLFNNFKLNDIMFNDILLTTFCFLLTKGLRYEGLGRLRGDDLEGVRLQPRRQDLQEGVDHDPPRPLQAKFRRLKRRWKSRKSWKFEIACFLICLFIVRHLYIYVQLLNFGNYNIFNEGLVSHNDVTSTLNWRNVICDWALK